MKLKRYNSRLKWRVGIFCFFAFSLYGHSQNYVQDMQKIRAHFDKEQVTFNVRYCFYPDSTMHRPIDSMKAKCCMKGREFYYKITSGGSSYEYFNNDKYYFVVDHAEETIAVKKNSESQRQAWDISKIDSLVHSPSVELKYKDVGKSKGEYYIQTDNLAWDKYKIVFDKKTYVLDAIYMYSEQQGEIYGEKYNKPVIGIYYSSYSSAPFSEKVFSESGYFTDTQRSIVLTDAYKKYKLLDYIYKLSTGS